MLKKYLTIKEYGNDSIIIRKSEFIGHAKPVKDEQEANDFINEIKKQHWNASHNCSAYVIGEKDEIQKANDDGEPSGTAGKPMLELLKKMGLKDTAVVVTRYFGGIMLGAGGLIRAYGKGAKVGVLAAGVIERTLYRQVHVSVDYTWFGKIENEMNTRGYTIHDTAFTDQVAITILAEDGEEQQLEKLVLNITSGQANISFGDAIYVDKPYEPLMEEEDQESSDS